MSPDEANRLSVSLANRMLQTALLNEWRMDTRILERWSVSLLSEPPIDPAMVEKIREAAAARVEAGWCQNTYALNAQGATVSWDDPTATEVCAHAAVMVAADQLMPDDCLRYETAVLDAIARDEPLPMGSLASYNDEEGRTVAEVAARLRGPRHA